MKKLEECKGNEVLDRALMTWDYQIILPKGAVLREEYLEKLKELGILEVWVKEEEKESHEIVILKSDIETTVKEQVKEILERHTYQHNKELVELSETADNIITTILEEEQVVEKIFDIKQRSSDIYEHSISICSLAILTALKMQVDKNIIHDIGVSCLLHDIGLRYLTIDFNNKDITDMTEAEQSEYKKHPVYGYTALCNEDWLSELTKDIILSHHERLDGSGYPLRKTSLTVGCRIVSICDAFDEMICGIGHKRMKVYEAIEFLKNFKHSKFDEKIVDVLLGFTAVYPAGTHVITNEGELAVVLEQNKDFQDRPIIRILKDKDGNSLKEEVMKDLVKVHNIFIEKVLD